MYRMLFIVFQIILFLINLIGFSNGILCYNCAWNWNRGLKKAVGNVGNRFCKNNVERVHTFSRCNDRTHTCGQSFGIRNNVEVTDRGCLLKSQMIVNGGRMNECQVSSTCVTKCYCDTDHCNVMKARYIDCGLFKRFKSDSNDLWSQSFDPRQLQVVEDLSSEEDYENYDEGEQQLNDYDQNVIVLDPPPVPAKFQAKDQNVQPVNQQKLPQNVQPINQQKLPQNEVISTTTSPQPQLTAVTENDNKIFTNDDKKNDEFENTESDKVLIDEPAAASEVLQVDHEHDPASSVPEPDQGHEIDIKYDESGKLIAESGSYQHQESHSQHLNEFSTTKVLENVENFPQTQNTEKSFENKSANIPEHTAAAGDQSQSHDKTHYEVSKENQLKGQVQGQGQGQHQDQSDLLELELGNGNKHHYYSQHSQANRNITSYLLTFLIIGLFSIVPFRLLYSP